LIFFLRRWSRVLKPEGEPHNARAMCELGGTIAGQDAGEPQAKMPALPSAQLLFEIDGRKCRQLIRPSRWRWPASPG